MPKAKTKTNSRKRTAKPELASVYLLKLVLYLIVGAQWLRFENSAGTSQIPIPVGFVIALLFAAHDHFQIDRKIEFAIILVAMFVGFFAQVGVFVSY